MIDIEQCYCDQLEKDPTDATTLEIIELLEKISRQVYATTDASWTCDVVASYTYIANVIRTHIKPIETEE